MRNSLKPVALAFVALLGIVVAGNLPPDSVEAAAKRIHTCVGASTLTITYTRECLTGSPLSWSASRPETIFIVCVKKSNRLLLGTENPRCGAGKSKLSWGGFSATKKFVTTCVDRRTKKMYLARNGKCGNKLKVRWVKSAPYLPLISTTTTSTSSTTTTTNTSSTTTTIAPSCANGRAACNLGDTGPGGGKVFYIDTADDFGWEYLEAAPANWLGDSEFVNWSCDGSSSATDEAIGDGRSNTLSMFHAQAACDGFFSVGRVVPDLVFNGKSDWFVPSIDELEVMANVNTSLNLGMDAYFYWSSTQSSITASQAMYIDVATGQIGSATKGGLKVRPIRAFGSGCAWGGTCAVGDLGPGGGRVFYVRGGGPYADWNYLEIAPSAWNGASPLSGEWCGNGVTNTFGAGGFAIGDGIANFEIMVNNCDGVADVVAEYGSEYLDLLVDDWFIPSEDEIEAAYAALNSLSYWPGDGSSWYWTSSEVSNNARVFLSTAGYCASTLKDATAKVIPIRAF